MKLQEFLRLEKARIVNAILEGIILEMLINEDSNENNEKFRNTFIYRT